MQMHNKYRHETYTVRRVSLAEAMLLSAQGIEFYDYTKLTAIDTCPTFGVIRYARHLTDIPVTGRNTAVECGSACHEFFAALRYWTLLQRNDIDRELVNTRGVQQFGYARWTEMINTPQDSDKLHSAQAFALVALHTSGYYDNPDDRKRTMSNMEVACITYLDRYMQNNMPIFVRDDFIGIEIPFVLEVTRTTDPGQHFMDMEEVRYYCGRIDGVHHFGGTVISAENKTAANLNDSWKMMFHTSHQVTGYSIALSVILNTRIQRCLIMGTQIPVPKDIYKGVSFEEVSRNDSDFLRWFEWFFDGVHKYEQWIDKPTEAPRYTHSCNRYFSTCQFLPFCTMERDEQVELLKMMREERWSPLDHLNKKVEGVEE